jgi:hypothetical protein
VERASRLIVHGSIILAGVAHAWLAHSQVTVTAATLAAFVVFLLIARRSLHVAVALVAGTAYAAPALLSATVGVYDYHQLAIWLAALAGTLLAHADPARWHLPSPWKFPVIAWALLLAMSWPVVAGRELDFSLVAARTHGVANGIALLSPPQAAAFVTIMALSQMLGLLWLDVLWARFRGDLKASVRSIGVPFVMGLAISSLVGVYQRTVDIDFLNLPIWANMPRAGGLMNDANSFGTGAAIWAPVAVALGWLVVRQLWIFVPAYLLLAAGMWSAGSRTALLAFGVGSVGLAIGTLKRHGVWQPSLGHLFTMLGVAILVLASVVIPRNFDGGSPLQRAFDRIPQLNATEIRRFVVDDLWLRFGYGQAAVDIVKDHPAVGVGVGAFHIVGPEYIFERTGRVVASDNAQNWWRHQVAELGILGAIPALWTSVLVLLLFRGDAPGAPPGIVSVLRASIIGIGLGSLFGVPTQHPATWLSFATLVFWLHTLVAPASPDGRRTPLLAILPIALAMAVTIGLLVTARGELRPITRALNLGVPHVQGLSGLEGFSDYGDFRWTGTESVSAVPVMNRWMQLTMWAPYSDVAARQIVATVFLDGRQVLEHTFVDAEGGSYFIEMPNGARAVTVAFSVRGSVSSRRAIQIATTWRPQVPGGTPAERIIR